MRSKIFTSLAAAVAAFAIMVATIAPPAAAQTPEYPPPPPIGIDCTVFPDFELRLDGITVIVIVPEAYLECVVNLHIEINPTLYDGPVPATRIVRVDLPPLEPGETEITATATHRDGRTRVKSIPLTAAEVDAINELVGGPAAGAGGAAGAAGGDGAQVIVLGSDGLAVTGSSVKYPLAIGALLIGAGGLALIAARSRNEDLALS